MKVNSNHNEACINVYIDLACDTWLVSINVCVWVPRSRKCYVVTWTRYTEPTGGTKSCPGMIRHASSPSSWPADRGRWWLRIPDWRRSTQLAGLVETCKDSGDGIAYSDGGNGSLQSRWRLTGPLEPVLYIGGWHGILQIYRRTPFAELKGLLI